MFKRIIIFVVLAYLPLITVMFVGCEQEETYTARIVGIDSKLHHNYNSNCTGSCTGTLIPAKKTYTVRKPVAKQNSYLPLGWIPTKARERNWQAIIIHHSATAYGSVASIDNYHRNVNGWDGIGYDFIIGNGNGCRNGTVESTFRWTQQRTGAHCKTASNWANEKAVGICLIGNFEKNRPTGGQMASLVKLVRFLSDRYDISMSSIYGHGSTPGCHTGTVCPGRNFSMNYVKANL